MANIAVDIDETLYSFDSAIRDVFFDLAEERDDKSILRLAYSNNFEWRNLVDHDKEVAYEAIERVHSKTDEYELFPGVHKTLWKIHNAGHEITYVGARKDNHYLVTKSAIAGKWKLPIGDIICANPQKPKSEYLTDCRYLIDDRPKTIFEFLYDDDWEKQRIDGVSGFWNKRKAFALWRPYNQNLTEVKNLYLAPTWRGLEFYLKRKGVI